MLAFQHFQHAFARHVRDPQRSRRPEGVPARRMALYQELLFNNICGFLDSCFPVCRQCLGEARWRRLCRTFYRDWPSHTPWFREIPGQFVRYLQHGQVAQPLPRWLPDLAHHEWAELAVDVMDVDQPAHDPQGDLMAQRVVLNPARIEVASDWPVHRIGRDWQPRRTQATFLLVYRDAQLQVRFAELNVHTARVLVLLQEGLSGREAMTHMAREMGHGDPLALHEFGRQLLDNLRAQGIVLGTSR